MDHRRSFYRRGVLIVLCGVLWGLPGVADALDGSFGVEGSRTYSARAGSGLQPGWGISGTFTHSLPRRFGIATGLYWSLLRPWGSDLNWRAFGLDVGLEYRLPGAKHVQPFLKGGVGFRSVVLQRYFDERTGTRERYRWRYDEAGNPVELIIDKEPVYTTYAEHFTEEKGSFVSAFELGIRFPVEGEGGADFAPEVGLRYVRYPGLRVRPLEGASGVHRVDLSSLSFNFGFKVLF